MKSVMLVIVLALALGCGQPVAQSTNAPVASATNAPAPEATATAEVYGAEKIINDMTGKTDVDAGRRAREKIKKINAKEKEDYKEVQDN